MAESRMLSVGICGGRPKFVDRFLEVPSFEIDFMVAEHRFEVARAFYDELGEGLGYDCAFACKAACEDPLWVVKEVMKGRLSVCGTVGEGWPYEAWPMGGIDGADGPEAEPAATEEGDDDGGGEDDEEGEWRRPDALVRRGVNSLSKLISLLRPSHGYG